MPDLELRDIIDTLAANKQVIELVKVMQPMDVVAVISKNLDICADDAHAVTKHLLQHVHNVHYESLGIETNKQYPIPPRLKRNKANDVEESAGNFVNNMPTYVVMRYHFPPDPNEEPGGWPYDAMTKQAMDPKNKSRKRPLMQGPVSKKRKEPGGDAASGGIYMKNAPHSADNSMAVSGRSWSKQGNPGWSASPPGKEFNLPGDENPPVGSPIPRFFFGTNNPRRMGFRRR